VVRVIGKKESMKAKAIFDATSSPKNNKSNGYQTTLGTAYSAESIGSYVSLNSLHVPRINPSSNP
jgi:hypothetical protein